VKSQVSVLRYLAFQFIGKRTPSRPSDTCRSTAGYVGMMTYKKPSIMRVMDRINLDKVNYFTLRKQHLTDDSQIDDIVQITSDISGLHATGAQEPYLALFARTRHFVKEQLDNELYVERSLGKIRCMRGTLYILTKEMISVAHAATKPVVEKLSRRYAEFRGVSADKYQEISKLILELLRSKEMTVAEIKVKLKTRLHLSAVLNLMCDQGLLLRVQKGNGWESKNYRYAVFKEYLKDVDLDDLSEIEAITRLVADYLKSFEPATEADIAWWTGLNKAKVREALKRLSEQTTHLSIKELDGDFIVLRRDLDLMANIEPTDKPAVNLLPTLDSYLMGYKLRERYLQPEHYDRIFDRSGNATSTILVDGRIMGVWDFSDGTKFKVFLFEETKDEIRQQIHLKAQEMGQFIAGSKVEIQYVSSMTSLTQRTAGGFMSPLKGSKE